MVAFRVSGRYLILLSTLAMDIQQGRRAEDQRQGDLAGHGIVGVEQQAAHEGDMGEQSGDQHQQSDIEQKAEKHGVGHRGFLRSVRDFRMGGGAFP